ncbi:hypothetical protein FBULB1_4867 [Fusarium bulbicola]|nr:hypothetical protein FBULB1_4867 [Fusarium bulbicola]
MRGPKPNTFPQRDTPRAPLKRKRDANAQAPTSVSEPKRLQRSSSFISIHSSSDEDEAPKANSSSRANAKSSPQQPRSNKNTMANFLAMGKQKPSQPLQQKPQQKPYKEPPQKSSPPKPSRKPSQMPQQKSSPPKPPHKPQQIQQQRPQHKPSPMPPQITQQMPQQTLREILLQKIQQLEQHIAEQKSQMIPQQLPPMQQPRTQPRPQQFPQQSPQQPRPMPLLPSNPSTSGPADNEDDFLAVDPVPEPTLCKEQQDLLDLILSGRNVFFTGSAGCGKSTVLKAAVKKLRAAGKIVHITAPTGRAALGVNGVTTWSYMGWSIDSIKSPLSDLKSDSHRTTVKARLMETDVLVIDEISMVENHHLQRMNECLKSARCWSPQHNNYSPTAPAFGGV